MELAMAITSSAIAWARLSSAASEQMRIMGSVFDLRR